MRGITWALALMALLMSGHLVYDLVAARSALAADGLAEPELEQALRHLSKLVVFVVSSWLVFLGGLFIRTRSFVGFVGQDGQRVSVR